MPLCPDCKKDLPDDALFCPACGKHVGRGTSSVGSIIGKVLNQKYRLVERMAEGGMAVIYKAEHVFLKDIVAVKVIKEKLAGREEMLKRFTREARLTRQASRRSPNVVAIHDFGYQEDVGFYYVMEFLQGQALADMLEEPYNLLPVEKVVQFVAQACHGASAVHAEGMVHRDLKPDNIFICQDPDTGQEVVKVLDFGIARPTQAMGTLLTSYGKVMGTPEYMSPEQCRGPTHEQYAQGLPYLDARSDVYSLGIVLYQGLVGEVPFKLDEDAGIRGIHQVMAGHLAQEPEAPSKARPDRGIGPPTEEVCLRALSKKPEERYEDMEVFRTALLGSIGQDTSFEMAAAADRSDAGLSSPMAAVAASAPATTPEPPPPSTPQPPPSTLQPSQAELAQAGAPIDPSREVAGSRGGWSDTPPSGDEQADTHQGPGPSTATESREWALTVRGGDPLDPPGEAVQPDPAPAGSPPRALETPPAAAAQMQGVPPAAAVGYGAGGSDQGPGAAAADRNTGSAVSALEAVSRASARYATPEAPPTRLTGEPVAGSPAPYDDCAATIIGGPGVLPPVGLGAPSDAMATEIAPSPFPSQQSPVPMATVQPPPAGGGWNAQPRYGQPQGSPPPSPAPAPFDPGASTVPPRNADPGAGPPGSVPVALGQPPQNAGQWGGGVPPVTIRDSNPPPFQPPADWQSQQGQRNAATPPAAREEALPEPPSKLKPWFWVLAAVAAITLFGGLGFLILMLTR